jgi:N-acetylglucosamine-6-phosphate deacetylase
MATQTPAAVLGRARKGRVAVGCDADIVVLADDFSVQLTMVRGVCEPD